MGILVDALTLDVDSTVITRCGQAQGATKGYNHGNTRTGHNKPMLILDNRAGLEVTRSTISRKV